MTRGAYGSEPRSEGVARPDMMEVLYNERRRSAYILHLPVTVMSPTYPLSLRHIAKACTEARRLSSNCQLTVPAFATALQPRTKRSKIFLDLSETTESMNRNPLTTADIPSEFWEDAYLVGKVPFKAASVDQRASYCMYVPKKHYKLEPLQKLPLIVSIHGNGRNAERCRDTMIDLADREGAAILAPLFPAGINDPNDMQNYKMLSYEGLRYDLILLGIIDEIGVRWPGIATANFFLTGYSGGGQFALRFFYLHPARLEAVSIGAPGLVTQLDNTLNWPKGIKGIESLFAGLSVDLSSLRNVGVQLFVGSDDTKKPGGGLVEWLRGRKDTVKEIKELSSSILNRNESMLKLQEGFKSAGIQFEFEIINGMAHENGKAVPKIIEFLEPHLANWHSKQQSQ